MSSYWSCSKFADWLRGTPSIESGTIEEWNDWEKIAKKKKVRYWLAEEGLDYLQNFVFWPSNRLRDLRIYINNRFVSKTHALTSTLKRGQWHEFETRLLHSAFDELVNFVEKETAWHHVVCLEKKESKKYRLPWHRSIFCMRSWRSPEAGLAHLEWAAELKHDEDWVNKDDPEFGQPTHQALAAREIILLYKWWKEVRPQRPDPMDASGWSDFCEEMEKKAKARGDGSRWAGLDYKSDEDEKRSREILETCHKMEQEQTDEDTDMLIRLVKIRQGLWT